MLTLPGRTLPFVAHRAWKVPTGLVSEEFRLVAPSGRVAYRWGPNVRRMLVSSSRASAASSHDRSPRRSIGRPS